MKLEKEFIFTDRAKFVSKKYLKEFISTVSKSKIEENIINDKIESRAINIAVVNFFINENKPNKFKHKNLYLRFDKLNNELSKVDFNSKGKIDLFSEDKFRIYKNYAKANNFNKEYIKILNNIYSKLNKTTSENEIKEKFRQKLEAYIKNEKITYSDFTRYITNSKIDKGNLNKFIKNKEYNRLSMEKILIIRNGIENEI